jgi:hypothetical protein
VAPANRDDTMISCDKCGDEIEDIPVRAGDDAYHAACWEKIVEDERDYQSVLDSYKE